MRETGGAKSDRRDGGVFKSLDYDKLVKSDDGAQGGDPGIVYRKGKIQRP